MMGYAHSAENNTFLSFPRMRESRFGIVPLHKLKLRFSPSVVVKVSQDQIERIREATNIVDLVSEHVRLKRRGRNFVGLCPFHNEKTPSFNILEDKGIFKCFGCGKGGDAFSFVMQMEAPTFPEALRKLAKRANIEIEGEQSEAEDAARSERESLQNVLREAAAYYYRRLRASEG